ncbi:unnamed protein product [Mytilus coruscus]|uniref:Uncharacterized protein n=1 Tax=Mytilus coruscus TaxID=42192 RepID=A0A6J8A2N5_MYTCO|nr:unnamed protein product [Mytilus coruscus]
MPVHVDLTSTWKVCTNAMVAVCDELPTHVASSDATVNTCVIPVPSAKDYLKAVIAWSARQHQCSERKEYINLTGAVDDRQNNLMNQQESPSANNFVDDSYDTHMPSYTSTNESDLPLLVRHSPRKPNRPTEKDRQIIYPMDTATCSYESQPHQ